MLSSIFFRLLAASEFFFQVRFVALCSLRVMGFACFFRPLFCLSDTSLFLLINIVVWIQHLQLSSPCTSSASRPPTDPSFSPAGA